MILSTPVGTQIRGPRLAGGRAAPQAGPPRRLPITMASGSPPSLAPGLTELAALKGLSTVIPDTVLLKGFNETYQPTAASVNAAMIRSIASQGGSNRELEIAVETALSYPECTAMDDKGGMLGCMMDKSLANVGSRFAAQVEGKVSTEIDMSLANDTKGIVAKAKHLLRLYEEMSVAKEKLLFKVPATWAGIQAVRQLEAEGISCHVSHVYCFVQAAAAAQAGASVIQPYVGRVRDWYRQNPNAIHDPHGPREDAGSLAGYDSKSDAGLALVKKVYNYVVQAGHKSQVMAASIRSREDALALAGAHYMVVSPKILDQLDSCTTDAGYNDGLRAGESTGIPAALTPEGAGAAEFAEIELREVTEQLFDVELTQCARDLMDESIRISSHEYDLSIEQLDKMYPPSIGGV